MLAFLGGTGPEGKGLALRLAMAGESVVIGSRDAGRAQEAADELLGLAPGKAISGAVNGDAAEQGGSASRVWMGFFAAAAVVLVAAYFLALSADGIAEATGLGRSFVGVLLVSIVTTLPEASVTVTAAMRKSYGLVIGNIYGSCAFNLFVIPIAGLFFVGGPLLGEMEDSHFVAAISAIGLMTTGFIIIRSFKTAALAPLRYLTFAVPPAYVAALAVVYSLSS